jgi:hypothetical protein
MIELPWSRIHMDEDHIAALKHEYPRSRGLPVSVATVRWMRRIGVSVQLLVSGGGGSSARSDRLYIALSNVQTARTANRLRIASESEALKGQVMTALEALRYSGGRLLRQDDEINDRARALLEAIDAERQRKRGVSDAQSEMHEVIVLFDALTQFARQR